MAACSIIFEKPAVRVGALSLKKKTPRPRKIVGLEFLLDISHYIVVVFHARFSLCQPQNDSEKMRHAVMVKLKAPSKAKVPKLM